MSDVRKAARQHALELNRHTESLRAVAAVQQKTSRELVKVKDVLKDVTGRPSCDLYGRPSCDLYEASGNDPTADLTTVAIATSIAAVEVEAGVIESAPSTLGRQPQFESVPKQTPSRSLRDAVANFRFTVKAVPEAKLELGDCLSSSQPSSKREAAEACRRHRVTRQAWALACLVFVANSTAVITNAVSLCQDPRCLRFARCYGIVAGSLAIIWFLYEHIQKARKDRQEKEDQMEPICEVVPLDCDDILALRV